MTSIRKRRVLQVAGLVAVGGAAFASFAWWYASGPGLDKEADRLIALLDLKPGMTVAEIGAGKGDLAVRVASRLGPSGRLYATDIVPERLEAIRAAAAARGLTNITVLSGAENAANLPEGCCDAIYMRRVYHDLTQPAPITSGIHAALRPGGRFGVIDFATPWWFRPRHGIEAEALAAQVASAGFTLAERIEDWSRLDYFVLFERQAR
jgi:ubiquinone/menaquinone biosynthesis C-methylase UbiE